MRPHSECLAMFFNVKAAVSLMCFVTGPSFSSCRTEGKTKAMHEDTAIVNINPACGITIVIVGKKSRNVGKTIKKPALVVYSQ